MKKLLIGAVVAAAASLPGVTGLVGNASFAQSVPVEVPAGARTIDDHGQHPAYRDDRSRHAEPGDDRSGPRDPGTANATRGSDEVRASASVTDNDGRSGRGADDEGVVDQ